MPRTPNLIPPVKLTITLPLDLATKLSAKLYSELEGRVPYAAYAKFFAECIRLHFDQAQLDLAPWAGTEPELYTVSGTPAALEVLKRTLKGDVPA